MEILGTTSATGSNAATSQTRLAGDYDSFLQLLTTQLKNQDPLAPLDATQFVSQLSQFAMVEQAVQTNKNLESLLQSSRNAVMSADVGLIGRQVEPGMPEFLGQLLEPVVHQAELVHRQFAGRGAIWLIHLWRTPSAASWSSPVLIRAERVVRKARRKPAAVA